MEPPIKVLTPYGGRLIFKLPGGSNLVVHLKDKSKIRNKKRWSQVMYMYYLLGYKYFTDLDVMEKYYEMKMSRSNNGSDKTEKKSGSVGNKSKNFIGFGNLLKNIDKNLRIKVRDLFIYCLKKI